VGIAFLLGTGILTIFSRTDWGRQQVLAYTLQTLGGSVNARLAVERIDGNLLTGARLYGFTIADSVGVPLAVIDSLYLRYRVATFPGGDIVITRLQAYGSEISIFRLPGDTLWNYQGIFQGPAEPAAGEPRATLIEHLELYDAKVSIRAPLAADSRLPAARQEEVIQEILADTARWMIEGTDSTGYIRTTLIDVPHAEVQEVYIGPDEREGIFFNVIDAGAVVRLWMEPPLEIRTVKAQMHLQAGIVNYRVENVELANSVGTSVGRIDLTGDRPMYDVFIDTPRFAVADLRWLYPWLPADTTAGRGSLKLWLEDKPDGLQVVAREVVLDMPGTRITGRFGLFTEPAEDALHFVDVDLQADPMWVESVERLLPEDLPVDGLVVGGVTIRGS
jgi:hypothetical protein